MMKGLWMVLAFFFYKDLFIYIFLCVNVFPTCMQHVYCLLLQRPEEGTGSPGTGVMDGCNSPCFAGN